MPKTKKKKPKMGDIERILQDNEAKDQLATPKEWDDWTKEGKSKEGKPKSTK